MIIHKLVFRYLKHKDDPGFYLLQAQDTVRWLEKVGIELSEETTVLDLACGHGNIGGELLKKGCRVTFADELNSLLPEFRANAEFRQIDIDRDDLGTLGTYDLVICSNVLEHIPRPAKLIDSIDWVLNPGGKLYLSWTNWLSPWGGQDYSPFHYLGPRRGHLVYDKVVRGPRTHTPYVSLFPTSIGGTLRMLHKNQNLRIVRVLPRYYPELGFITRIPFVREFLTINCLILVKRRT